MQSNQAMLGIYKLSIIFLMVGGIHNHVSIQSIVWEVDVYVSATERVEIKSLLINHLAVLF